MLHFQIVIWSLCRPSRLLNDVCNSKYRVKLFIKNDKFFINTTTIWIVFWILENYYPECSSNVTRIDVIEVNRCEATPGVVNISCTAKFNGNIPPTIVFRDGMDLEVIDEAKIINYIDMPNNRTTSGILKLVNEIENHESFVCEILSNNRPRFEPYCCRTPYIHVFGKQRKFCFVGSYILKLIMIIAVI